MEDKTIDGPSFEDIEFPVPFGHISAKWWGPKDKKPLIAIHGLKDNSGTFDPLIKLLPKDLSILCIDLIGHGRSSHMPQGFLNYLLWDGLIILRRIVRQYNWRCISIMGHSLGADIGFLYAATYPYDTEMLISIDTVAPIIFDPSEIVKNTGRNLDKFLYLDELVKEQNSSTLAHDSDEILMKSDLYPLENDKYMFSKDLNYKVSWMSSLSLDIVKELASHVTCRYMHIKVKPCTSLDNWPVYSEILEIIKTNAKEYFYKEYDGNHYIHFNNPECIASDIATFIVQEPSL